MDRNINERTITSAVSAQQLIGPNPRRTALYLMHAGTGANQIAFRFGAAPDGENFFIIPVLAAPMLLRKEDIGEAITQSVWVTAIAGTPPVSVVEISKT